MREFEGGARVVVEPAHQAVVQSEGHTHHLQDGLHLPEVFAASFIEKLADARQAVNDRLIARHLAIKHAQRIGHGPALAIGTHLRDHRLQCSLQSRIKGFTIPWATDGVQFEIPALDAETIEQRGQHLENLRIAGRRLTSRSGRTDDLRADLKKLPVAALLRTLPPKLRPDVVELVEPAIPKLVLDVGTHHAGRVFRTQRERLP